MAKKIVTTLAADTTTFNGMVLELYQNAVVVGPNVGIADLTPATFDGYAPSSTVSFSGPAQDPAGNGLELGSSKVWISTGAVTPNTIQGVYGHLTGSASTTLCFVEPFTNPISIANAGDFVDYQFRLPYPGPVSGTISGP
jgi:hypothetical protein